MCEREKEYVWEEESVCERGRECVGARVCRNECGSESRRESLWEREHVCAEREYGGERGKERVGARDGVREWERVGARE